MAPLYYGLSISSTMMPSLVSIVALSVEPENKQAFKNLRSWRWHLDLEIVASFIASFIYVFKIYSLRNGFLGKENIILYDNNMDKMIAMILIRYFNFEFYQYNYVK